MEIWKMETKILWLMFMVTSRRIIVYEQWAKTLMDNNIFSSNGEKYYSVVVITIMFLCFDVKV